MRRFFVFLVIIIIIIFEVRYSLCRNKLDVSFPRDIRICQTPLGEEGDCKPLSECQSIYPKTEDYVRRSHCGFTTDEPEVCCPLNYSVPYRHSRSSLHFISSHHLPSTNLCGKIPPTITHRIRGGVPAKKGEFPWMALLQYKIGFYKTIEYRCGGFLINERYVLTAAHCVNSSLDSVILGINNYIITNENNKTVGIEKNITFESYPFNYTNAKEYQYHDIALLRLKEKINYSPWISPICLPTTIDEIFKSYVERNVEVAGWGATGPRSAGSNDLMKISVPIVDCRRYYWNWYDHGQLCAFRTTKDSCRGDSGGPMMVLENKSGVTRWYAIGIVSAGPGECNTPQYEPGIYTKVAKYMYWIRKNLEP